MRAKHLEQVALFISTALSLNNKTGEVQSRGSIPNIIINFGYSQRTSYSLASQIDDYDIESRFVDEIFTVPLLSEDFPELNAPASNIAINFSLAHTFNPLFNKKYGKKERPRHWTTHSTVVLLCCVLKSVTPHNQERFKTQWLHISRQIYPNGRSKFDPLLSMNVISSLDATIDTHMVNNLKEA